MTGRADPHPGSDAVAPEAAPDDAQRPERPGWRGLLTLSGLVLAFLLGASVFRDAGPGDHRVYAAHVREIDGAPQLRRGRSDQGTPLAQLMTSRSLYVGDGLVLRFVDRVRLSVEGEIGDVNVPSESWIRSSLHAEFPWVTESGPSTATKRRIDARHSATLYRFDGPRHGDLAWRRMIARACWWGVGITGLGLAAEVGLRVGLRVARVGLRGGQGVREAWRASLHEHGWVEGKCWSCGYPKPRTDRCPECGAAGFVADERDAEGRAGPPWRLRDDQSGE